MKYRLAAALAILSGSLLIATPARSAPAPTVAPATTLGGYAVTISANVFQLTEDYPTASAHPLVEGDGVYSFASLDPSRAHALSAALWPGSLGGNLGSLVAVLGGPSIAALNYPVKAEAPTGSGAPQSTLTAGSAVMTASTENAGVNQQTAEAAVTATSADVGVVAFRTPSSHAVANLDQGTGKLTASATAAATGVNIAGLVTIGSIKTTLSAISTNGSPPVLTGTTDYHDMAIAGTAAYVDSTGVHLGSPGKPAGSGALDAVNTALNALGMKVYFTSAQTVKIGTGSYFYPASILILFTPPGDSNHDTITIALGAAAASMIVAGAPANPSTDSSTPPSADLSGSSFVSNPGQSSLQLPTSSPASDSSPSALSGPAPSSSSAATPVLPPATQLAVAVPHGLGIGWLVVLALIALAGAVALPRVPALLRAASPGCDREQPWPDDRPDRRS